MRLRRLLHGRAADGEEELLARAVVDASGTYGSPNPLGATGMPAIGEAVASDRIAYGIPDVLGRDRSRYAGRRVIVVGSGHSAMGAVLDLAGLAEREPGTTVTWAVRRPAVGLMFGGGADDALPARGGIGARAKGLVDAGAVGFVAGFATSRVRSADRRRDRASLLPAGVLRRRARAGGGRAESRLLRRRLLR